MNWKGRVFQGEEQEVGKACHERLCWPWWGVWILFWGQLRSWSQYLVWLDVMQSIQVAGIKSLFEQWHISVFNDKNVLLWDFYFLSLDDMPFGAMHLVRKTDQMSWGAAFNQGNNYLCSKTSTPVTDELSRLSSWRKSKKQFSTVALTFHLQGTYPVWVGFLLSVDLLPCQ